MSFLEDPDHLRAVAEEWGTSVRTLEALIALVDAAHGDGMDGPDAVVGWITERGYGEVRTDPDGQRMRITPAGYQRGLG